MPKGGVLQAEVWAHLGCRSYQGYLFSRPLDAFEAFTRSR